MAETDQRHSPLSGFILVGVPGFQDVSSYLWSLFLVVYILIVVGNASVLYMVVTDKRLHISMYFLIANLAAVDLVLATAVIPKMLVVLIWNARFILWTNCFVQMYLFHAMTAIKMLILSLTAYDRSVAICDAQSHSALNRDGSFVKMAAVIWVTGLTCFLPPIIQASIFPFCGSNEVYNSFCDLVSVTSLICTDPVSVKFFIVLLNVVLILSSFVFIVHSHIRIIKSVRIAARSERRRALSTCIPHVTVIWLFFPLKVLYSISFCASCISPAISVTSAILYVVLNPLLSPLVYVIATKEMREKIVKLIVKKTAPHIGSTVAVERQ